MDRAMRSIVENHLQGPQECTGDSGVKDVVYSFARDSDPGQ